MRREERVSRKVERVGSAWCVRCGSGVEATAGAAAAEASVRGRGRQKAYVRLRPLLSY